MFFLARTFLHTGAAAVEQMDPTELALLARIEKIQRGMSRTDVEAILGEPDQDRVIRLVWFVNGRPYDAIAIDFLGGARRVLWISVGRFVYDRPLGTDGPRKPDSGPPTAAHLAAEGVLR